jgi:hypothetical protein
VRTRDTFVEACRHVTRGIRSANGRWLAAIPEFPRVGAPGGRPGRRQATAASAAARFHITGLRRWRLSRIFDRHHVLTGVRTGTALAPCPGHATPLAHPVITRLRVVAVRRWLFGLRGWRWRWRWRRRPPAGPHRSSQRRRNSSLQALLQATYPGGTIVAGPGTDDSVMLDSPQGDPLQRAVVPVGAPLSVAINYTSQQPVTAMCVGFGSPNNAYCVPVGTPGVITTGLVDRRGAGAGAAGAGGALCDAELDLS